MNVIFAVTENLQEYYNSIQRILGKFTYIAKLESDSSNILNLVKKGYQDIVSIVNFDDDAGGSPLQMKYYSDCGGDTLKETAICNHVEFGMTLNYEVRISLPKCEEYVKVSKDNK